MARSKYGDRFQSVVTKSQEEAFISRCRSQLEKMGLQETEEEQPIFGAAVLDNKSKSAYIAKLRRFVEFLMAHSVFDDSLVLFYPKTPRGMITCEDKAASYFLLSVYTKEGDIVRDTDVRWLYRVSTIPATLPIAPFRILTFYLDTKYIYKGQSHSH